jgi:hypothetical protein
MGKILGWILIAIVMLLTVAITFFRTPEQIVNNLGQVASQMTIYSLLIHILFVLVLIFGFAIKKIRNDLFALFMAFISLSATIIAVTNKIVPNVLAFGLIFILVAQAYLRKKLDFASGKMKPVNIYFAIIGLLFGFWYLHWVNSPIALNALLYSPMGVLNCPTLLTLCGFLCLTSRPKSVMLETVVALYTIYFGFFGLLLMGVWFDSILILTGLFLLVRVSSMLSYESAFES